MSYTVPDRKQIGEWLKQYKTIAVVGLSDNPERTSYQISAAMQQAGYRIIPVNPNVTEVLGEKAYPSLLDIPEPVDIVNVFRRSEHTPDVAREAVKIKPKLLWLQLGISNDETAQIAEEAGIPLIMDRCIKVEHALTR